MGCKRRAKVPFVSSPFFPRSPFFSRPGVDVAEDDVVDDVDNVVVDDVDHDVDDVDHDGVNYVDDNVVNNEGDVTDDVHVDNVDQALMVLLIMLLMMLLMMMSVIMKVIIDAGQNAPVFNISFTTSKVVIYDSDLQQTQTRYML